VREARHVANSLKNQVAGDVSQRNNVHYLSANSLPFLRMPLKVAFERIAIVLRMLRSAV
jgi:hypothetical protein